MFCRHCGNRLEEIDKFCGKCGKPVYVGQSSIAATAREAGIPVNDTSEAILFGAISFVSPIVGFVLAFACRKDKPKASTVALVVSIIRFAFVLLWFAFWFLFTIA